MSAIQKRLIKELRKGTILSIKNMYKVRCSNISREIRRQVEEPFKVSLNRKKIEWIDEYSSGYYYEYSLNKEDKELFDKLYVKHVLKK